MKCEFCELARDCKDPAQSGGGCDMDGVDDFGAGNYHDDLNYPEDDYDFGY